MYKNKKIIIAMVVMAMSSSVQMPIKANTISEKVVEKATPNFNKNDIRGLANISVSELRSVVPKTMESLCNDIVYYSNHYGINALAVCGIIRQESGNNTSRLAKQNNNLGGITNGQGSYRTFKSKTECIEYMVRLLKTNYLTPTGKYFNGYSLREVNELYCPGDKYEWSNQVALMGNTMLSKIKQLR